MSEPLVSVVLPCHNAAATLAEAISSIQSQTRLNWELIVFDDGSTDDSAPITRSFSVNDARVRLFQSDRVGIVEALRRGCAEARGPFIARMDGDDIAHPERLAKQMALMAGDEAMGLCGTLVRMFGKHVGQGRARYADWLNSLVTHEDIVRELFVECPVGHPTFLLRREAFEAVGGYEEHGWAEDHDLCMRLFAGGWRFGKVQEVLLNWRESPGRLSRISERYSHARFRALKRHYLFKTYLNGRPVFHQWGAGEVGKQWLREWETARPQAVVDINPRKIGRKIHDTLVIPPEDLPTPGETFIIIAVGAPGARDDIRAWLNPRGYCETQDYLFVA